MRPSPLEMSLPERKVDLVERLFIHIADNDYLAARWAFSNAMTTQFYWASAQAIEKYTKSLLLLNDKSIRSHGHDVIDLWNESLQIDENTILPRTIFLPETSALGTENWEGKPTSLFIDYIHTYGSAENRYGIVGANLNGPVIHILDTICASIRTLINIKNLTGENLFEKSQSKSFFDEQRITDIKNWMLNIHLPLEKLHSRNFEIGQSNELRNTFSNRNMAFFDEHQENERTFGGTISTGSPIWNHLVRFRNPQKFGLASEGSSDNTKIINELKRWVDKNIPVNDDKIKKALNDSGNWT